ncbi:14720_t:CDS:2 [Entrophospora sp. SA101]|nr:14720_t:CDS:2 [Entrophospora sp. SA101]
MNLRMRKRSAVTITKAPKKVSKKKESTSILTLASSTLDLSTSNLSTPTSMPTSANSPATSELTYIYMSILAYNSNKFASFSSEIFVKICEDLPPLDIFALSRVCKLFRQYLCTSDSLISQIIWRKTRLRFLIYPRLPPPQGMSELRYIRLAVFDKRCEFCGLKRYQNNKATLYWEFQVRCCDKCLFERTKTFEEIEKEKILPTNLLDNLSCLWIRGGLFLIPVHRYYWIPHIVLIINEYTEIIKNNNYYDLEIWLRNKIDQQRQFLAEVSIRYEEHRLYSHQ